MDMKSNSCEIGFTFKILNMADELFNDALYYREMADSTDDYYLQWRYRRSAIISFCASAEAWMNNIIKDNLESKSKDLNVKEQKMLEFIRTYDSEMPKGFNSVRNKLYNFIPKSINGVNINWNKNRQENFEKYIKLSNMRNSVVHYAISKSSKVYSRNFIDLLKDAPDIIEGLFQRYSSMGSILKVPEFYKHRESRTIE